MATPWDDEDVSERMRRASKSLQSQFLSAQISEPKTRILGLPHEGPTPPTENEKVGIHSSWATLLRLALRSAEPPQWVWEDSDTALKSGDTLFTAALQKAVKDLHQRTGLSSDVIQAEIRNRLKADRVARKTTASAIRFLRDADETWFTECPHCGAENPPGWERCAECNQVA